MSIFSIFKPRSDGFSLGRFLANRHRIETSPFENELEFDKGRTIHHFLLMQLFLMQFSAMHTFGDEGPAERLLHGLRAGFTEKYPFLAPDIGIHILSYARIVEHGLNDESGRQLAMSYCTNAGVPHQMLFVLNAMNFISTVGLSFHSLFKELAAKTRLT